MTARTTPSHGAGRTSGQAVCNALWLCAVLVPALLAAAWAWRPVPTAEILPAAMRESSGAYSAPVAFQLGLPAALLYANPSDDLLNPARSSLMLYENGVELGPAHTPHEQIRTRGGGPFSHWNDGLVFSSRDGTDPRTNGRRYTVKAAAQLRPAAMSCGLALFLGLAAALYFLEKRAATQAACGKRFKALMVCGTPAFAVVAAADIYVISEFHPLLTWDSPSFLAGGTLRGFAYAAVLKSAIWAVPSGRLLVPLQLGLMVASFLALGWAVGRLTRNALLGWGVALFTVANTGLTGYSLLMLSEPIFIALVALHFAAVLCLLRRSSTSAAVSAGLTAGLAILLRPAGYSLLLTIPFVVVLSCRDRLRTSVRIAAPAAALLAVGTAVNFMVSGSVGTHSIGGLSLLGHVLHLAKPGVETPYPELYGRIVEAAAPAVRSAGASYPDEYRRATSADYNKLLYGIALPRIIAHLEEQARRRGEPWPDGHELLNQSDRTWAAINGISMALAIPIVRSDVPGYLRHAAAHLHGMWANLFKAYGPMSATLRPRAEEGPEIVRLPRVKEYFHRHGYPAERIRARVSDGGASIGVADALWSAAQPVFRLLAIPAPLLTLGAAGAVLAGLCRGRKLSPLQAGLAICSLHIWAYFGLVAGTQAALDRYSVVFEPVLMAWFAMGCALLVARMAERAEGWLSAGHDTSGADASRAYAIRR